MPGHSIKKVGVRGELLWELSIPPRRAALGMRVAGERLSQTPRISFNDASASRSTQQAACWRRIFHRSVRLPPRGNNQANHLVHAAWDVESRVADGTNSKKNCCLVVTRDV
jgi:hypothetical protein